MGENNRGSGRAAVPAASSRRCCRRLRRKFPPSGGSGAATASGWSSRSVAAAIANSSYRQHRERRQRGRDKTRSKVTSVRVRDLCISPASRPTKAVSDVALSAAFFAPRSPVAPVSDGAAGGAALGAGVGPPVSLAAAVAAAADFVHSHRCSGLNCMTSLLKTSSAVPVGPWRFLRTNSVVRSGFSQSSL